MDLGVSTGNGFTSSVKVMWNCSPSMLLICPSKTVGYANIAGCSVRDAVSSTKVNSEVISCIVGISRGFG